MGSNVILDGSYFVKSMLSIADISGSNTILQCITFKSNFPQQYLYTYVASKPCKNSNNLHPAGYY